ncbi:MAG: bifunctional ADP-dependent (S)-NAD(P)H-hydrate dehydratase/NAD(P)H-hydrate epimerase [Promicromonosporaceae bacterium]|nr:bifunctional ADP-dependent (S)-NAD(P)H-hydrate dehydratase/NAD(P)H-hydrate epimerase [Promicromonosporaceae bacterium]
MLVSATVPEIRAAEEPLLAAGIPLMQQAARAVADTVVEDGFQPPAAVALLVGAGNNGGDALWAGSFLADSGYDVTAYLLAEQVHEEGLAALIATGGRAVNVVGTGAFSGKRTPGDRSTVSTFQPLTLPGGPHGTPGYSVDLAAVQISGAVVILDGILGIGASGALRGVAGELVTALLPRIRPGRPWVIAVDCPSGITLDGPAAGQIPGVVLPANHTITFGAPKPGLELPPASNAVGKLTVLDLGMELDASQAAPAEQSPLIYRLSAADVAHSWPVPGPNDQKYTRGVVGVIAGTNTYPGAAILTCAAAVNAGAGMVRYTGPSRVAEMVISANPEVVPVGGQVQALVLGPGVPTDGHDDGQLDKARAALAGASGSLPGAGQPTPAVVDAGALTIIVKPLPPWVVLTPHSGEMATLLSAHGKPTKRAEVEANPLAAVRAAHQITGATVLLKGATTLVVGPGIVPGGQGIVIYSQADAPYWLATAGAGDVLAGLLGTMLAARSKEVVATPGLAAEITAAAALVHGLAAARVNPGGPITALEVAQEIPRTIAAILRGEIR